MHLQQFLLWHVLLSSQSRHPIETFNKFSTFFYQTKPCDILTPTFKRFIVWREWVEQGGSKILIFLTLPIFLKPYIFCFLFYLEVSLLFFTACVVEKKVKIRFFIRFLAPCVYQELQFNNANVFIQALLLNRFPYNSVLWSSFLI